MSCSEDSVSKRRKTDSDASNTAIVSASTPQSQQMAVFQKPGPFPVKPKKKILEEERFVAAIEKIITRDFFPDLPKLQAQHQYLDAVENGDMDKLRDIHIRYQTPLVGSMTPGTFETPAAPGSSTPRHSSLNASMNHSSSAFDDAASVVSGSTAKKDEDSLDTNMSLNEFLMKYTSEDNSSFDEIIEEAQDKLRKRYKHLYEPAEKQRLALTLPTETKLAIKSSGVSVPLDYWQHTPSNALMFPLTGAPLTEQERADLVTKGATKVNHSGTRFDKQPFPDGSSTRASMTTGSYTDSTTDGDMSTLNLATFAGTGSDSPKVNGYGFVVTPSPAPGIDDNPLMTWGMIDGTPFRLDGGDVAHTPGPVFKIQESNSREKLGHRLADRVHEKYRKPRADSVSSSITGDASRTPRAGSATPGQLARMSPAAQRLSKQVLKNTPSIASGIFARSPRYHGGGTPIVTPRSSSSQTPRLISNSTDLINLTPNLQSVPASVTDDLLS